VRRPAKTLYFRICKNRHRRAKKERDFRIYMEILKNRHRIEKTGGGMRNGGMRLLV